MFRVLFCLFFLLNNFRLSAEEICLEEEWLAKKIEDSELNTTLFDLSSMPSSVIGGSVNAITGNYFESECDLTMAGGGSLTVVRSFNSGSKDKGTLCHGWDLNLPSEITFCKHKSKRIALVKDRGADLLFEGELSSNTVHLDIPHKVYHHGVTNCTARTLSSRTNIKNRRLKFKQGKKHCEQQVESGEIIVYKNVSKEEKFDGEGNLVSQLFAVEKALFPNGCHLEYGYDKKDRLKEVRLFGRSEQDLGHITLAYLDNKGFHRQLHVSSPDGRSVKYNFFKAHGHDDQDHSRYFLDSVVREHGPEIKYIYKDEKKMVPLVKKSLPDGRYLQVDYYVEGTNKIGHENIYIDSRHDSRVRRVAALYAPLGTDASPILAWKFKYDLNKDRHTHKPIGGHTEVTDALGRRTIYRFSDEQRLTAIDHFLDSGRLYRSEQMVWGGKHDETLLMTRGLVDENGKLLCCRRYKYDKYGNALEESLCGNLSGWCLGIPTMTGEYSPDCDRYTKTYTYTEKGLLQSEDDGRKKIVYHYWGDTDLVRLKLVYDRDTIRERYYFDYDSNCALTYESIDDGNSPDINNLSGVTERRIKRIEATNSMPACLPRKIEEYSLNLATGKEELLARAVNEFSKEGWLIHQDVYDSNGKACYSIHKSYNAWGKVIQENDPLGQVTSYRYDNNGNMVFKQTPNPDFHTVFTYDYSNRLIREEEVFSNGNRLANAYAYDYRGNKIATTDFCGNTTQYRYDEFGRLVEKISPAISDGKHGVYQPIDKVSYDIFNNPVEKIDSNHFCTKCRYSHHGKPNCIEHPDGCVERSVYSSDGTLWATIDVYNVTTYFSYDYNSRKIKEEKFSPEGILLSTQSWVYNAFHLLAEIDPAGIVKTYSYDNAGRLVTVKKGVEEMRFAYDSLGRQSEILEFYDQGNFRKTKSEYDYLNRKVQQKVEDEQGNLLSHISFSYDWNNNKTHEIVHTSQGSSCKITQYDHHNKPIKIIAPDGSETHYRYSYDYKNEFGQTVCSEQEIDPNGNLTIKIMDACGRLAKEERKDPLGNTVKRTHFVHDGEGNLIQRKVDVIASGIVLNTILTEFRYDPRNRQIAVIEASGDPIQKTTKQTYRLTGELEKIIKPDGIVLQHTYDYLSRLVELRSSDGSVIYTYQFDLSGHIVRVDDHVHHTTTHRAYDQNDRMIFEQMANGLQFAYSYDALGRLKEFKLPNQTTIDYQYDAKHLKAVGRCKNGNSYRQHYNYDLSGRLTSIEMPNGLGTISYSYDSCLRPKQIESPYWMQHIAEYDPCGNVLRIQQRDAVGETTSRFSYDPLHHLVSETGCAECHYAFDSVQNRLKKNEENYDVNALNQLRHVPGSDYHYDPNGNLSSKRKSTAEIFYQYDALDRLIGIETPAISIEYQYDSFHRRVKKTITHKQNPENKEITLCGYQAENEIGSFNQDGNQIELRIIRQELGANVMMELQGQVFVPLQDYRGNVTALLDIENRCIRECYRYSAYGEEQLFNGSGASHSQSINPWRFSSKRMDSETGWVYFGRRYYDPDIGRWTTPDPLGFVDGFNLYCYVQNRPLFFVDSDGRFIKELIEEGMKIHEEVGKQRRANFQKFMNHYEEMANALITSCMKVYLDEDVYFDADDERGYSNYSREYITKGKKLRDDILIIHVNGAGNRYKHAIDASERISRWLGGVQVEGIYNATFGMFDAFETAANWFGYKTRPAYLLKEKCENYFARCPHGKILITDHSQGSTHANNFLTDFDKDLRKNIYVFSIAPIKYIEEELCGDIRQISSRDIVPLIGRTFSNQEKCGTIIKLIPHSDASLNDHSLDSKTFDRDVPDFLNEFLRRNNILDFVQFLNSSAEIGFIQLNEFLRKGKIYPSFKIHYAGFCLSQQLRPKIVQSRDIEL